MKLIAGTLLLALTPLASAHDRVGDADRACITCHGEQAKQALTSVHAGAGIGCITCHGGHQTPRQNSGGSGGRSQRAPTR